MISASGMVLALKLRGLFPYIHTWGACAHIPPTASPLPCVCHLPTGGPVAQWKESADSHRFCMTLGGFAWLWASVSSPVK